MPQTSSIDIDKKILIVEDDRTISSAIESLLIHYNFEVCIACSLSEANQALTIRPDLVILDVQLPDGDGLDLLEKIRQTGQKCPVFILTGSAGRSMDLRLRRLKPDRYFRKPFDFMDILESIRDVLTDAPAQTRAKSVPA